MTTVLRRPFSTRQLDSTWPNDPVSPDARSFRQSTIPNKRSRSPDTNETNDLKRVKSTQSARDAEDRKDKLQRREQREQANKEFLARYTKAFPSFTFYFDDRDDSRQHAESRVLALGASIDHFFSAAVTHVITNRPQPPKNEQCDLSNKENAPSRHLSKIALNNAQDGGYDKLVRNAVQLHKKIWSASKLENVLSRLISSNSASSKVKSSQHSTQLNQLLHHERIHGTTSERDPRERRHDYQYFSKSSYFFLVEDIRSEIAPIAIMEYSMPTRPAEKDKEPSYPVLYMHRRARSPFIKYDEKEARKQNKIEAMEKLRDIERDKLRTKFKRQLKQLHDEKRIVESGSTVSMASGFGQSATGLSTCNGYLAASGNSVPITSTTTTSLAHGLGSGLRLPNSLRERLARQVVTNRRLENLYMGESRLRKAKSTTTIRLPAREESKKPGYCEACHIKFEDFKDHIRGSRHRKFAQNQSNYIDLDFLLIRLRREINTNDAEASPPQIKVEDEAEDTCLRPGDYFYVSPEVDDWEGEIAEVAHAVEENSA